MRRLTFFLPCGQARTAEQARIGLDPVGRSDRPEVAVINNPPVGWRGSTDLDLQEWPPALIEMVRLLGVYFTHARNGHGQRVTAVLFDQVVRCAALLEQLPGQDGSLVMQRVNGSGARALPKMDYTVCLGSLRFHFSIAPGPGVRRAARFAPMGHTFSFFARLGVPGLAIRLPGSAPAQIEQLRLALEIVSRYPAAAGKQSDLVFALHGRPCTVALVRNVKGRPDLSLTLLGGINALSAANARKLVRQADALTAPVQTPAGLGHIGSDLDCYAKIISTPGLSSGLARPLVEVAWGAECAGSAAGAVATGAVAACDWRHAAPAEHRVAAVADEAAAGFVRILHFLHSCLDARDEKGRAALDRLVGSDCAAMGAVDLFYWLDSAVTARRRVGQDRRTRPLLERFDAFVLERLGRVPAALWAGVALRGTSIALDKRGRTFMLGMVPEEIGSAVALVRERVMYPRKLAYIISATDPYQPLDPRTTASLFGVSEQEARQVVKVAAACFHDPAGLGRRFQVDPTLWNEACQNALAQILWCHLRGTPRPQSHLTLLGGLQLQLGRLREPAPFMNFLLTGLLLSVGDLSAADYDALVLCSLLLQGCGATVGVGFTDAAVLDAACEVPVDLQRYVAWRLAKERPLLTLKFELLAEALRDKWRMVVSSCGAGSAELAFLLDLQREGLLFLALAGGKTARRLIRQALRCVLDQPAVDLLLLPLPWRQAWLAQLNLALRALSRVAAPQDDALLATLVQECGRRLQNFAPAERAALMAGVTRGVRK